MYKILNELKFYIRKIKPIFYLLKSLQDKRYFYFMLQGFFTNPRRRNFLAKIEAGFFRSDKKFSDSTQLILKNSYIENLIDIDASTASSIKNSLTNFKCHDLEAPLDEFLVSKRPVDCSVAYYHTADLFKIKKVLEIAINSELISVFNHLYKCDPIIDHIGAWWSFPCNHTHGTQNWHRDIDTLNQLKFFLYLTDVGIESGPHILITGSHKEGKFRTSHDQKHRDEEVESLIQKYGSKTFIGGAGTNFLENNFAFHKGVRPKKDPRLLLQIIYSRIQTPFSPRKPFIDIKQSEFSEILSKNAKLFQKIVIS